MSNHTQRKQEICLAALRGECPAGAACANFHARNRSAVLQEYTDKHTSLVCAYHLRGSCSRGDACRALHALPAGEPPAACPATAADPVCRTTPTSSKGKPRRPVPRVVRLASQARGKAKLFDELASGYARLAQAAGPDGGIANRARCADAQKKAFEVELETLVARLEIAIQVYSKMGGGLSNQGFLGDSDASTIRLIKPADQCMLADSSSRAMLC